MVPKTEIINAIESRFDYTTARIHFRDVTGRTGAGDKDNYSPAEIGGIIDALKTIRDKGGRIDAVAARLGSFIGGGSAPAAAAPAPAPKAAEAPKAEAAPAAEAKAEEPKADEAAPAEGEAEAKADDGKKGKKKGG